MTCTLWEGHQKFRVDIATANCEPAALASLRRVFSAIHASIQTNVEPRLVANAIAAISSGNTIHIGQLAIRQSGITVSKLTGRRHYGWGEVGGTERSDGLILIRMGSDDVSVTFEVPTTARDAILIPELLKLGVTRFA